MSRRICVTADDRRFIARAMGCTERMVFMALSYRKNSELALRIRKLAMERGGKEWRLS